MTITPRQRRRRAERDLRAAVDALPVVTRQAMLDALHDERIISGAYSDRSGGMCPMLAAHRRGGRSHCESFAPAWDRFTRAKRGRTATPGQVAALEAMLRERLPREAPAEPQAESWLLPVRSFEHFDAALQRVGEPPLARPHDQETAPPVGRA